MMNSMTLGLAVFFIQIGINTLGVLPAVILQRLMTYSVAFPPYFCFRGETEKKIPLRVEGETAVILTWFISSATNWSSLSLT